MARSAIKRIDPPLAQSYERRVGPTVTVIEPGAFCSNFILVSNLIRNSSATISQPLRGVSFCLDRLCFPVVRFHRHCRVFGTLQPPTPPSLPPPVPTSSTPRLIHRYLRRQPSSLVSRRRFSTPASVPPRRVLFLICSPEFRGK